MGINNVYNESSVGKINMLRISRCIYGKDDTKEHPLIAKFSKRTKGIH